MENLVMIKAFGALEDPRNTKTKNFLYPLGEILLVAFATILSGGRTYVDMCLFGNAKLDFFKTLLPFESGIPSPDTFEAVFGALNPKKFEECFLNWINDLKLNYNGEFIGIDGKKLRRSKKKGRNPLHVINAWSHKNRAVLGCKAIKEGGGEIATVPEVLKILSLKGAIVTMDAMGSQKVEILNQIVEQGGDYVIALKANQLTLHNNVKAYLEDKKNNEKIAIHETIEKDHGRIERRKYGFTADILEVKNNSDSKWYTVNGIGYVEAKRTINEKTSIQTRYFIVSSDIGITKFVEAVRGHWGIENNLHNFLDVALLEDLSRVRNRNAAQNLAVLRRMGVNRIEKNKKPKLSKRCMLLKAGWDTDYLKSLLFQ